MADAVFIWVRWLVVLAVSRCAPGLEATIEVGRASEAELLQRGCGEAWLVPLVARCTSG
jgi:hypothetical protein